MRHKHLFLTITIIVAALLLTWSLSAQDGGAQNVDERYVGTVPAPEFPAGLDWLNVEAPLTLDGLRGKIILLDFWTYGCINCIHMIPVLEEIEAKYAEEIVVIGVHSAKFENEGQTENIRQIIQRYELHHPVINDHEFAVWGAFRPFGVNAWPTFVVIEPRGNVIAVQSGEIPFEAFDQYFSGMIAYYDGLGTDEINRTPLELAIEGAGNPGTPLLYPGKVMVDPAGGRLFISDTNHHRIVIADLETFEVLEVIGSGQRGLVDGAYDSAAFDKPQGTALDGSTLYIADTNNHAIRAVDLESKQVRTIAGTGLKGRGGVPPGIVIDRPLEIDLRSPWDVEMGEDNILHIAMAGTHQLWAMNLAENTIYPTVGSGRESLINRSLAESELAQPSGLYYVDGLLYFADSESSSIRVADFNLDEVRTLAGPEIGVGQATAQNILFLFDDVDGRVGESRLQHALGVTSGPAGRLYIADTYNSKIKVIDVAESRITSAFGQSGSGGFRDGGQDVAAFDEPGGIDYADGKLYVADTNNHAIRIIDLTTNTVSTVNFPNPEALAIESSAVTILGGNSALGETIRLEEQALSPGENRQIVLKLTLPEGYKINTLIDSTLTIESEAESIQLGGEGLTLTVDALETTAAFTVDAGEGGQINADLTLYYCRTDEEGLCFIDETHFEIPFTLAEDAAESITLDRVVKLPVIE